MLFFFFFSSRRRHTRLTCDWSSDVCSSDLRLEKIQKQGRVLGLLGHGVQIRALPFEWIQKVGSVGPFLIEVHTFPAIADAGPNLPTGVGSEYEDSDAPTIAARFIAIQLDKTIISVGQRSS